MTGRARELRAGMTEAEACLWNVLRREHLGVQFRRQFVFDGRYILDFFCRPLRLAIEVDGSHHVENAGDLARDAYLAARGVEVLRFWNNAVLTEMTGVLQVTYEAVQRLKNASPRLSETSPLTPHLSGGGDASYRAFRTNMRT